jgi:hypothetical protein
LHAFPVKVMTVETSTDAGKTKMNRYVAIIVLLSGLVGAPGNAQELPRLSRQLDPKKQNYQAQKKLADLPAAYVSTSPQDLGDGLHVGTLDVPGAKKAVAALVAADAAGHAVGITGDGRSRQAGDQFHDGN